MLDDSGTSSYFKSVQNFSFSLNFAFFDWCYEYTPYPSNVDKKKNQDSFPPQH